MEEISQRIVTGATELFMRYGVKSITMDDIARHLSISKKTIYQHFKDKDALVIGVGDVHMAKERCDLQEIQESSTNAIECLFRTSKYIKAMMANMNPSLVFDVKKYHPKAWQQFESHKEECVLGTIRDNLVEGVAEGYYHSTIDPEVLALMRMWQIELAFDSSVFPLTRFNPMEVGMQLFDHFIAGIVTEKGKKLLEQYQHDEQNS